MVSVSAAVDAALCFGWIDGVKKSVDADSYVRHLAEDGLKKRLEEAHRRGQNRDLRQ